MMRRAVQASVVALLLLTAPRLWTQNTLQNLPPWVVYENGVQHLREGRYGDALRHFRAAASARAPYPEAEVGIGQVFLAEGSVDLALRQFDRALEQAHVFEVPASVYEVRYLIAEAHNAGGDGDRYRAALEEIAADEAARLTELAPDRVDAYQRVLREQGIDRLMVLYRVPDGFSHRSRRELGTALTGEDNLTALEHLTVAAMQGLSTVAAELRRHRFDFTYTQTVDVLADALRHRYLRDYLERVELYRTLYYLAVVINAEFPESDTARRLWRTLASLPEAGQWYELSLQRIRAPVLRRS